MRSRHKNFADALLCILALVLVTSTMPAFAEATGDDDPNRTGTPGAQPRPEEAALLAGTQYRHVAGSAFVPLYDDAGVTYGGSGCTYMTSVTHIYSNYSLDLPHNSIVTSVRLYFNDTAPSDGNLYLAQYDDGWAYTYLASVSTTGSIGLSHATTSGLDLRLDYVNYNYVLYWAPGVAGSTMQLCGFRVSYLEPAIFADGFETGNLLGWSLAAP